jgi:hypothetical protein
LTRPRARHFRFSHNSDIEQLIELHGDAKHPGDVVSTWRWQPFSKAHVYLKLDFSGPVEASTNLIFPVATKGYVVDWIMTVRGFYLQSSKYGQYVSEGIGKPAIIVEVPASATFPVWPAVYKRALIKRFKKDGLRGKEVERAIVEYKARQREIWFRRPSNSTGDI